MSTNNVRRTDLTLGGSYTEVLSLDSVNAMHQSSNRERQPSPEKRDSRNVGLQPLPSPRLRRRQSPRASRFSFRTRPPRNRLSSHVYRARIDRMNRSRTVRKVGVSIVAIFLACPTLLAE